MLFLILHKTYRNHNLLRQKQNARGKNKVLFYYKKNTHFVLSTKIEFYWLLVQFEVPTSDFLEFYAS